MKRDSNNPKMELNWALRSKRNSTREKHRRGGHLERKNSLANMGDAPPNSLIDSTSSPKVKNNKRIRSWGTFLNLQHFGGRRACWSSRMGILGRMTSRSIIHTDLQKPNNKFINA
jgi:hypothetical protein